MTTTEPTPDRSTTTDPEPAVSSSTTPQTLPGGATLRSLGSLTAGSCLALTSYELNYARLPVIDCALPHNAEIDAVLPITEATVPGEPDGVEWEPYREQCRAALSARPADM